MPAPTGQDVADFLGRPTDTDLADLADVQLRHLAALAKSYCRGAGWAGWPADLPDDLGAVLVGAVARLTGNPEQYVRREVSVGGELSQALTGGFAGWTLAELTVLNSYRRRAA